MTSRTLLGLACLAGALAAPTPQDTPPADAGPIPQFALDHAPLIWIHSEDPYFPGPISAALENEHPVINREPVTDAPNPLTLSNLDQLNGRSSRVALQSNEDLTTFPAWFNGSRPDSSGRTSGDPSATVISVRKPGDVTDVFYMFWYPFNRGNEVFGADAGNHVGDWEHVAVRFQGEEPTQVWMSQHASGEAFTWGAVEKQGDRPVGYSARGSHATYASEGEHDHTIPGLNLPFEFFLTDVCDRGTLWDPAANAYFYSFDNSTGTFTPHSNSADAPVAWLNFDGVWGDEQLPREDPRQHYFWGIELTAMWTGGPTGPKDKRLGRTNICPAEGDCFVRPWVGPKE